jgi:transcriptional regulator with XRE-family HTH domain
MDTLVRQEIGRRIRNARLVARMTQKQVGEERGIRASRQTVSAWERGEYLPSCNQLYGLCVLFGASADYILFGLHTNGNQVIDSIFRGRHGPPPQT